MHDENMISSPSPCVAFAMRAAAERGRWLHALFERLPALAPSQRDAAANRWLAQALTVDRLRELLPEAAELPEAISRASVVQHWASSSPARSRRRIWLAS